MINQQLIDYLKEKTKGKLLMSPEQLSEEIGIPSKQHLSHIFMLRAFAKSLEDRATTMLQLAENLKDYANKKEMMEIFNKKFPPKQTSNP